MQERAPRSSGRKKASVCATPGRPSGASLVLTNSTSVPMVANIEPSISSSSITIAKCSSSDVMSVATAIESSSGRLPRSGVSGPSSADRAPRSRTRVNTPITSLCASKMKLLCPKPTGRLQMFVVADRCATLLYRTTARGLPIFIINSTTAGIARTADGCDSPVRTRALREMRYSPQPLLQFACEPSTLSRVLSFIKESVASLGFGQWIARYDRPCARSGNGRTVQAVQILFCRATGSRAARRDEFPIVADANLSWHRPGKVSLSACPVLRKSSQGDLPTDPSASSPHERKRSSASSG